MLSALEEGRGRMHITGEGWHCIGSVSGRGMAFR
jgi:hypothetical protein